MRILEVSAEADTAGAGWRMAEAFRAAAIDGWVYRAARAASNWIGYPVDLPWAEARETWRASDVVVVQQDWMAEAALRIRCHRPTIVAHHGTRFRRRRRALLAEQRRRRALATCSTLDLYLAAPAELVWMPIPVDLEALAAIRRAELERDPSLVDPDRPLRIATAPTNRLVKSTATLERAVARLARELPIELDVIERVPWRECLVRKARAHVYFDQVALGYGMSAVESFGMGIPVIAGGADGTLAELEGRAGSLPFRVATESTIVEALRSLVAPATRDAYAALGASFAARFHSPAAAVARMTELTLRAIELDRRRAA